MCPAGTRRGAPRLARRRAASHPHGRRGRGGGSSRRGGGSFVLRGGVFLVRQPFGRRFGRFGFASGSRVASPASDGGGDDEPPERARPGVAPARSLRRRDRDGAAHRRAEGGYPPPSRAVARARAGRPPRRGGASRQWALGADLAGLCREAAMAAIRAAAAAAKRASVADERPRSNDPDRTTPSDSVPDAADARLVVSLVDFESALARVSASVVRGVAAEKELPRVSWDDVGGLEETKRRLRQATEWPIKFESAFARLGLAPPRGVLLYGPRCAKTTPRSRARASGATVVRRPPPTSSASTSARASASSATRVARRAAPRCFSWTRSTAWSAAMRGTPRRPGNGVGGDCCR